MTRNGTVHAAVTGIGASPYYRAGRSPHSAFRLAVLAITEAIADAGLDPHEVDGLVTYRDSYLNGPELWSHLGLGDLRFCAQAWGGGGNSGGAAVQLGEAAIAAGQATHVVVFRSLNQGAEGRYGRYNESGPAGGRDAFAVPFGNASAVVKNALLTRRFMHEHGVSQEALAEISLASYEHAQLNPGAIMYGRPLTREAYHASRWIAEPLHLYDCCQESDGAAAVVLSPADRAADLPRTPVYVLAAVTGMHSAGGVGGFNDVDYPNGRLRAVGDQLWARAGVEPADVDVAQFYENFTGTALMAIADIGFCPPGEVEAFVSDGNLRRGGALPFNTSGGNLAEAYIHGFQLMLEAVRQVRGTSTCQVDDVELSLYVAGPGTPPSSAVLLGAHR
ncbi:MAG: acetyl-CoA acetyltransferase [Acidimicrobiia bacterium]